MKDYSYIFFLMVILSLLACQEDDDSLSSESNLTETITLKSAESASLGQLHLEVVEIQENRCPANANCVSLGEVLVSIVLAVEGNLILETTLCLGDCTNPDRSNSSSFSYQAHNYNIKLTKVLPFPGLSEGEEALPTATLEWIEQ